MEPGFQSIDEAWDDLGSLRDYLAADVQVARGVETEDQPAGGQGLDPHRANRFLRQLSMLADEEREMTEQAQMEISRIQEWRTERQYRIDARRRWLEAALEAFARNSFEQDGAKTVNLLNGTLRLRPAREHVEMVNEELFIDWAVRNDLEHLVRTRREPAKHAIGALATAPEPANLDEIEEEFNRDRAEGPQPVGVWLQLQSELADCELRRPIFDGEEIPGVLIARPLLDNFTVTPK
jgi:phage host-nuclease inhibitor protein Gam